MKKYAAVAIAVVLVACSGGSSDPSGTETPPAGAGGDDSGAPPGTPPSGGTSSSSGGTSSSGGPPPDGGAPTDAGGDAGSIPSCTGMAYCDDFESYASAAAIANNATLGPWTASVGGAAVMKVDGVKPYSGTKSLHITVPNADTGAHGTLHQAAAAGGALVASNDVFGRAMVFYSNTGGNDLPFGVHSWTFQSTGNSAASGGSVNMNLANGGTDYFLNYHPHVGAEQSKTGGKPTAGVWHCMQWEYDGAGTPPKDEGKIWVDGALVVDAKPPTQTWDFATPWNNFDFGFTHYQTTKNAIDVYLDDFALAGTMVACPK